LDLPPGEKALDVAHRDRSHVRLVRDVLGEQAQDVIVFLGRERFAEGADVLDEFRDRGIERDGRLGLDRFFNLQSARARGEFETFLLLCLDRFCRRDPRRLALSSALFAPLDNVASGTSPLDPFACIAAKRDVAPTVCGLHLFEDIDACHNSDSVGKVDAIMDAKWTLSQ
jgi:hypothetical protein